MKPMNSGLQPLDEAGAKPSRSWTTPQPPIVLHQQGTLAMVDPYPNITENGHFVATTFGLPASYTGPFDGQATAGAS